MTEDTYKTVEIYHSDMKISLLFPAKNEEVEETIRQEVNRIMSHALREQMEQYTQ